MPGNARRARRAAGLVLAWMVAISGCADDADDDSASTQPPDASTTSTTAPTMPDASEQTPSTSETPSSAADDAEPEPDFIELAFWAGVTDLKRYDVQNFDECDVSTPGVRVCEFEQEVELYATHLGLVSDEESGTITTYFEETCTRRDGSTDSVGVTEAAGTMTTLEGDQIYFTLRSTFCGSVIPEPGSSRGYWTIDGGTGRFVDAYGIMTAQFWQGDEYLTVSTGDLQVRADLWEDLLPAPRVVGDQPDEPVAAPTPAPEPETVVVVADAGGVVRDPFPFTEVVARPEIREEIDLGLRRVAGIASVGGSLWTKSTSGDTTSVLRIDPGSLEFDEIELPGLDGADGSLDLSGPVLRDYAFRPAIRADEGAVWASAAGGRLHRVDASTGEVVETVDAREAIVVSSLHSHDIWARLSARGGPLWWQPEDGDTRPLSERAADHSPTSELWFPVMEWLDRVDPVSGETTVRFEFDGRVGAVVVSGEAVWVMAPSTIYRIDPARNEVVATLPLSTSAGASSAVLVDHALFAAFGGTVFEVDTTSNTVVGATGLGRRLGDLAVHEDELWMSTSPLTCCENASWIARVDLDDLSAGA